MKKSTTIKKIDYELMFNVIDEAALTTAKRLTGNGLKWTIVTKGREPTFLLRVALLTDTGSDLFGENRCRVEIRFDTQRGQIEIGPNAQRRGNNPIEFDWGWYDAFEAALVAAIWEIAKQRNAQRLIKRIRLPTRQSLDFDDQHPSTGADKGKPGRPSYPDDIWAREEVLTQPWLDVYKQWVLRPGVMRRELRNPLQSFKKLVLKTTKTKSRRKD